MNKDDAKLSELIVELKRNWLKVFLLAAVLTSAVLIYTWWSKPKWKVSAAILIVTQDDMSQSAALGSLLGKESSSPIGVLMGVLNSRSAIDFIASQAGMKPKELREILIVKDAPSANQLKLEVTVKDPQRGIKILNSALDVLTKFDKEASFSTSAAQLKKLESLYIAQQAKVEETSRRMLAFQQKAKVFVLPSAKSDASGAVKIDTNTLIFNQLKDAEFQASTLSAQIEAARSRSKQTVSASSSLPTNVPSVELWRKRLTEAQYELNVAQTKYSDEYPEVKELKAKVQQIQVQLESEVRKQLNAVNKNIDPEIANLLGRKTVVDFQLQYLKSLVSKAPDEYKSLRDLERELTSDEANLQQLRAQLQQARIKTASRLLQWRVLDDPKPSDEPTNKDFGVRGAATFLVGTLLSILLVAARILGKSNRSE